MERLIEHECGNFLLEMKSITDITHPLKVGTLHKPFGLALIKMGEYNAPFFQDQ